jgi:hypothetical protein
MEDVVGVLVTDRSGRQYGFMTWGRIVDAIDTRWLKEMVDKKCRGNEGIVDPIRIEVCESLRELSSCKYFHEGLFSFSSAGIPFGKKYRDWHKKRLKEYERGRLALYFLGERSPS